MFFAVCLPTCARSAHTVAMRKIMMAKLATSCSGDALLSTWPTCYRAAAIGAALMGSASLAHGCCMIIMVCMDCAERLGS